jgi:hypothetical protein
VQTFRALVVLGTPWYLSPMKNEQSEDEDFGSVEFDDVFAELAEAKEPRKPKFGDGGNLELWEEDGAEQ